jgi:hypothetical protein
LRADGDGKDSRLFSGKKKSFKDEVNDTCKLSWRNRVIGFCVCCAIGIVLSFLVRVRASLSLSAVSSRGPAPPRPLYTDVVLH